MNGLLDARGCLTDRGLDALAGAPVGEAPAEAAAHLARCVRCQDRLLQRGREATARPAGRKSRPYRNLALVGGALLLILLMLGMTLVALSGR